ncbi:hypothetical protein OKA05_12560 [Luteolibacter arcticus]|uniref:Uncharacterized protein n=1 Tax=Luteolibacter arcticus TaxID=1581411 RepID=A0ABT3GIP0_9BACT|nr:choice-of-anchor tandem repeat GloVer-containing protein [Luteolibacter arcticus]MCW1923389.1 hypothetical protein [Luteolibacter arcticus]
MNSPSNRRKRTAAAACFLFLLLPAHAGLEVLHSFQKPGVQPVGELLPLAGGESYGTCSSGGAEGAGSVFRVTPGGAVETVASFGGSNGSAPTSGLVQGPDQALYGTTSAGGAGGFGTVFKVTTTGVLTKLTDFTGAGGVARGSVPGPLVLHTDGFFYGTTAAGGTGGFGTVFKVSPAGAITTLAEFTGMAGAAKGSEPGGSLVVSGDTIYGVCRTGGTSNLGTVYRLSSGTVTTLVEFTGNTGARPGARPAGGLVLIGGGLLFGTTEFGGAEGFGTAFSLTTGASPVFTPLRSFSDLEGSQPVGEMVTVDASTLLGTVAAGGASGWGGIFKLTTGGAFTMLASFTGESGITPGAVPRAGIAAGDDGYYHGCTSAGGAGNLGTVFKVSAAGNFTPVASLSPANGWMPSGAPVPDGAGGWLFPLAAGGSGGGGTLAKWAGGSLTVAATLGGAAGSAPDGQLMTKNGVFYGLASQGAASGRGSAFRYDPASGISLVNSFTSTGGSLADGGLINGSDGALYGASREGGTSARGTLFKVTTAGVRTRIVSFTGNAGAFAGSGPRGPLVLAGNQSYYGVTSRGGTADCGVLFKLSSLGAYTVLAHFAANGPRLPSAGLVAATDGMIYGTCRSGGTEDAGAIIRLNPANDSWTAVASFDGTTLAGPDSDLHAAADGYLVGLASGPGNGGVFRYTTAGGLSRLAAFNGISATADDGAGLIFTGGVTTAADGTIYGTAAGGGSSGGGVFFRIVPDSPLAAWKAQHLGNPAAADDGDPDGDGLANLVEYALLTIPTTPDPAPTPVLHGGKLDLMIPRDPSRNDIAFVVEASGDLVNWSAIASSEHGSAFAGPGYVSGETGGPGVKSILVRDLALPSETARFLRVKVTH